MNSNIPDYVTYLSAWCKTRNNTYKPLDTNDVYRILVDIVKNGSVTPLKTFKEKFLSGEISFGTYCIGLSEECRKERFDACMAIVRAFEKEHCIEDE